MLPVNENQLSAKASPKYRFYVKSVYVDGEDPFCCTGLPYVAPSSEESASRNKKAIAAVSMKVVHRSIKHHL
jgi:hypothetical protein